MIMYSAGYRRFLWDTSGYLIEGNQRLHFNDLPRLGIFSGPACYMLVRGDNPRALAFTSGLGLSHAQVDYHISRAKVGMDCWYICIHVST